jgi:hypothetical protein
MIIILLLLLLLFDYYLIIIFVIIIIISIIIIHILIILINNCQTIFSLFRIVKNITLLKRHYSITLPKIITLPKLFLDLPNGPIVLSGPSFVGYFFHIVKFDESVPYCKTHKKKAKEKQCNFLQELNKNKKTD